MIRHRLWRRSISGAVARHGDSCPEKRTFVSLIFIGNTHRYRFQALETGGRLEVRALLAAVQRHVAFRARTRKVSSRGKRRRAIKTAGGGDVLHQAREAGAGYVDGRAGALGFRTVRPRTSGLAVVIHVSVLSILAITVHGKVAP
jgi:hypothetical protein